MQILGLLGMSFDAVVVEIEKYLLFFKLALAILLSAGHSTLFIENDTRIITLIKQYFIFRKFLYKWTFTKGCQIW
mgnify:CR=1 FL=1